MDDIEEAWHHLDEMKTPGLFFATHLEKVDIIRAEEKIEPNILLVLFFCHRQSASLIKTNCTKLERDGLTVNQGDDDDRLRHQHPYRSLAVSHSLLYVLDVEC